MWLVDLHDLAEFAAGEHPARRNGRELLVADHVVVPEQHVVGGEEFSVRPPHTRAQLERVDLAAFADLERLRDVGDRHRLPVRRPAHQALVSLEPVQLGERSGPAGDAHPPRAAVGAEPVDRLHDQWTGGQALLQRREISALHELGESGCLLVRQPLTRAALAFGLGGECVAGRGGGQRDEPQGTCSDKPSPAQSRGEPAGEFTAGSTRGMTAGSLLFRHVMAPDSDLVGCRSPSWPDMCERC